MHLNIILMAVLFFIANLNYSARLKKADVFGIETGDTFYFQLIEDIKEGKSISYKAGLIGVKAANIDLLNGCFAKEAQRFLAERILGKIILIDWGNKKIFDKKGRLMVYVYVDGKDTGAQVLKYGYGWFSQQEHSINPERKKKYLKLEKEAREKKLGLWGVCF